MLELFVELHRALPVQLPVELWVELRSSSGSPSAGSAIRAGSRVTSPRTTTQSAAETAKAQRRPPSEAVSWPTPSPTSEVARLDMTVTTRAVPMAPATCWVVPSSELPCE